MAEPVGGVPPRAPLLAVAGMMAAAAAGLAAWSGGFGARVGGPDLYLYFLAKQAYYRAAPRFRVLHAAVWADGERESLRVVTDPAFDPAATVHAPGLARRDGRHAGRGRSMGGIPLRP